MQKEELDEMMQEQAESEGRRAQRPWELFSDRTVRWQLVSVAVISSAMQLCGNDSVSDTVPQTRTRTRLCPGNDGHETYIPDGISSQ